MKLILIVFSLFLFIPTVNADIFPPHIFNPLTYGQKILSKYKTFFYKMQGNSVINHISDQCRDFLHSKPEHAYTYTKQFRICWDRATTNTTMTEYIIYQLDFYHAGTIKIHREGVNLIPTSPEKLFSFNFPGSKNTDWYTLEFSDADYTIQAQHLLDEIRIRLEYRAHTFVYILNVFEYRKDEMYIREYKLYCNEPQYCDNLPELKITSRKNELQFYEHNYYVMKMDDLLTSERVTPAFLNNLLNQMVNNPMQQFTQNTLEKFQNEMNWPQ